MGPMIAGYMFSLSLELSKPWLVWRCGLGIFAAIVWLGGWLLKEKTPDAVENTIVRPRDDGNEGQPEGRESSQSVKSSSESEREEGEEHYRD